MEPEKYDWKKILLIIAFIVLLAILILPREARFAGSHTMYENKSSSQYGRALFCNKCHPEIVANLSTSSAHNITTTGCICHGYNPNVTVGNLYDINLNHSLTKNIYCTNCHTEYNATGDLFVNATDPSTGDLVQVNVSGQSPHYLFNVSDATEKEQLYIQSKNYFLKNLETLKSES
ncbi:MAG: hypothetical protein ACE5PM_09630 [Candidatus Hydrothermarchaeales archaeon]